jgi:hypothetical protein
MKSSPFSHIGVVSCSSDVIDKVTFVGERTGTLAKLEITFCTNKKYSIEGSAACDIWVSLNLAVSNNESIGQWFNREVRNQFDLVSA